MNSSPFYFQKHLSLNAKLYAFYLFYEREREQGFSVLALLIFRRGYISVGDAAVLS